MKKLWLLLACFSFSAARAEIFMLSEKSNILYDNSYPLNEYLISDSQNKCVFHYLSSKKIPDGYMAVIVNESYPNDCLKKGLAKVVVLNEQNQPVESFEGYFTDGFFVGYLPLNAQVIKRFSDEQGTQYLYFLLDEDRQMQVRYLALMYTVLQKNGNYAAFDVCRPFDITLQTSNKMLIENKETLKNLTGVAKNYAQTLCPGIRDIMLHVSDSPSLDPDSVYLTYHLHLGDNGVWMTNVLEDITHTPAVVPDEQVQEQINDTSVPVLSEPTQPEPPKKKKHTGKTPEELLEISAKSGMPVLGQFAVHITNKTNKTVVFADKPFVMKAFGNELNLSTGWYQIKATVQPMSDFEKKRSGLSLNAKAAIITIQEAVLCTKAFCED